VKRAASITVRIAIIGFGILLTRHSASSAAALPNLSGSWKLNAAQSDDPQKMRDEAASSGAPSDSGDDAAPPSSGSGGGGHRGGRGWGGRHRGGRGDGSGGPSWLEGRESLVIRHADPELDITDAAGHKRTIYTDGRKAEEEHSYGGTTKVVAEWKDGHIEVTSQSEKGLKVVQTYAMSADGSRLTVTTKIEGRRSMTLRSVYDAVKAPASSDSGDDDDVEVTRA
jgi:hypothetical protein